MNNSETVSYIYQKLLFWRRQANYILHSFINWRPFHLPQENYQNQKLNHKYSKKRDHVSRIRTKDCEVPYKGQNKIINDTEQYHLKSILEIYEHHYVKYYTHLTHYGLSFRY